MLLLGTTTTCVVSGGALLAETVTVNVCDDISAGVVGPEITPVALTVKFPAFVPPMVNVYGGKTLVTLTST